MFKSIGFFFLFCILLSCTVSVDLLVEYDDFPETEKSFLSAALDESSLKKLGIQFRDNEENSRRGIIVIRFEERQSNWQESGEAERSGDFILFSRICFVYPIVPWDENISRTEPVPLRDLAPPYAARKIDGLDVSDPRYPLVMEKGIRFYNEGAESRQVRKKIDALMQLIKKNLEDVSAAHPRGNGDFLRENPPRLYRIAAGGDVMLARGVEGILFAEGPEGILGGTAVLVKEADLSLINLEGVVSDRGEAVNKTYVFRFDPRVAPILKDAGFDAVLLANNHTFDYGMTGFFDSLDHLEKAGIGVLGAGRNIRDAASPFIAGNDRLAVRVFGLASYPQERSGWDGLNFAADDQTPGILHAGKRGAELIKAGFDANALNIVIFHGGIEYTDYPDRSTRSIYTDLIRSGADLVLGTHPHVEQGFEWVEGKPVFWSLGGYVFDEMDDTPGGDKGIFVVLSYNGHQLVHMDIYPVFMAGPRTVISPPEQLERFFRLSRELAASHN